MSQDYPAFLEDDLADILASDTFDQPAEYLPAEGQSVAFRGVFSAPTEEGPAGSSSAPMAAQVYTLAYKETDLPRRLKYGDRLRVRGQVWEVYKPSSDGQGLSTVWLHLVNE